MFRSLGCLAMKLILSKLTVVLNTVRFQSIIPLIALTMLGILLGQRHEIEKPSPDQPPMAFGGVWGHGGSTLPWTKSQGAR